MTLSKLAWRAFEGMKGLLVPIICAPMHGVSGAELAGTVAKGGGMGFLGSGFAKDKEALHRFGSPYQKLLRDGLMLGTACIHKQTHRTVSNYECNLSST